MCLHIYLITDFDSIVFPKRQKQTFRYFHRQWNAGGSGTCFESVELLAIGCLLSTGDDKDSPPSWFSELA